MKNPERSEKLKRYWASLTPEQRRERNKKWQKAGVDAVKTQEVREKQSELAKERWSDPEYKDRHSAGIKRGWDESPPERRENLRLQSSNISLETRNKRSVGIKNAWANRDDESRKRIADKTRQTWLNKETDNVIISSERRQATSQKMKDYWASLSPEERQKRNAKWQEAGVEATHLPENRAKQSKLTKERWSNPEYKARHGAGIKKAWDESPPERREKMSQLSSNLSDETRQKRSKGLKRSWDKKDDECRKEIANKIRLNWKNKSEEEIAEHGKVSSENMREYWSSFTVEERRERNKEKIKAMHAAIGTDGPSSIEIAIQRALNQLGIKHEVHKIIGHLTVDIYIPELNLIVECDGNYWHNLPGQKHKDMKRDYWLRSQGFRVVRIWEKEINQSALTTIKTVLGLTADENELPKSLQLTFWDVLDDVRKAHHNEAS